MLAQITKLIEEDIALIQVHDRGNQQVQILWMWRGEQGSCLMPGWVWNAIYQDAMDKIIAKLKENGRLK